jgi:probable F420-dependent oxidoreductase
VVRVGVSVLPQHADFADLRRAWRESEAAGVDTVFVWDHFYPLFGEPDGKHFECWMLLSALAEVTERVEIGALVTCNSYRNPNLLADMARTVDHISAGRLILGIGSGWFRRDYDEYGYEFGTAARRLRHLAASLPVIRNRLEMLNPLPLRRLPILVGGGGEQLTLRIVAQHADVWHASGDVETMRRKVKVLRGYCSDVGRDFGEIELSTFISPESFEHIDEFRALGFTHVIAGAHGPDFDLSHVHRLVEWRESQ